MKHILRIIALVFIPLITASFVYIFLARLFFTPIDANDKTEKFIIVSNDYEQISKALVEAGLIKNPKIFQLLLKLRMTHKNLIPGEYSFSKSMTPFQMTKKINTGDVILRKIQINGGDTVDTIAQKIANAGILDVETLQSSIYNKNFITKLSPSLSNGVLEGYLLPAKYTFTKPVTAEDVFSTITKNSDSHWKPYFEERAKTLGLDRNKIIILASIIEKEVSILNIPKDLKTLQGIADVYQNRLKKHLPLNAMAPLYYIKKDVSFPLTEEDKQFDNVYNTFMYEGLPPSAICNPSYNTIKATLYPSGQGYISFNVDIRSRIISFNKEE